jgi:RNA polymerase sigma factor (TIGR02999 family)
MSEVTRLLDAAAAGDRRAPAALLPLVYDELRRLAAAQMANEPSGHTLDATALVHEAYLKLAGRPDPGGWEHRRHFIAAAAEAMRRVLVDHARRKRSAKRGGGRRRVEADDLPASADPTDWLAVNDAFDRLEAEDPGAAAVARLKVFAGASVDEAADLLGVSRATAYRDWAFARAWLREAVGLGDAPEGP